VSVLDAAGAVVEVAGADGCVVPLAAGWPANRLGAGAVVLAAEVPDVVLETRFPPRLPKKLDAEAVGALALGAVVVVLPEVAPNKLGVEEGAEEVGGLLRLPKRLDPPVAGVEEPAVVFGVPKRLPAAGADDDGCDVGVLLWKLKFGLEVLEAVVGVAAGPEVAGIDELRLLNKLLDPAGFALKSPPEGAEVLGNSEALLAGVCAESEGFDAPNIGVC
jgi:hypothetical protein